MKRNIFIVFAIVLASGFVTKLNAQNSTSISYSIAIPTGSLGDFIGKTSFRGINLEYYNELSESWEIGFRAGINVFYEQMDFATYEIDNVSISGKQYRYSNHVPLLLNTRYSFMENEKMKPFAGMGIGTIYSRRNTDMGFYTFEQTAWNFALVPSLGMIFNVGGDKELVFSAQYNYGFKAGELSDPQNFLSFNLGFVIN